MSFFIPAAYAQAAPAGEASPVPTLIMFGILFLIMYFMMIRPQRKRQKEHQNLITELQKGDEVITSAGILGKVVKVNENYMTLSVNDSTELTFQKVAVHAVLPKGTIKSID